jgi:F0F1-type ATP synthase delta subunit
MRYTAKIYASALYESLKDADAREFSDRARKFYELLRKHKALKFLPAIFKLLEKMESGRVATVVGAKTMPAGAVKKFNDILKVQKVDEKTMPEMLGGMVIEWDDWRIDSSAKGRLRKLQDVLS